VLILLSAGWFALRGRLGALGFLLFYWFLTAFASMMTLIYSATAGDPGWVVLLTAIASIEYGALAVIPGWELWVARRELQPEVTAEVTAGVASSRNKSPRHE
jgi:hypothetical protein